MPRVQWPASGAGQAAADTLQPNRHDPTGLAALDGVVAATYQFCAHALRGYPEYRPASWEPGESPYGRRRTRAAWAGSAGVLLGLGADPLCYLAASLVVTGRLPLPDALFSDVPTEAFRKAEASGVAWVTDRALADIRAFLGFAGRMALPGAVDVCGGTPLFKYLMLRVGGFPAEAARRAPAALVDYLVLNKEKRQFWGAWVPPELEARAVEIRRDLGLPALV